MVDADTVTRLRRVVSRLARQLNASATGEGLTPSQASVLGQIAVHGPLNLADLIDLERLNPTMLSRVIGNLEAAGLVSRAPDPSDLRAVRVEVTPDGKLVHDRIRAARTAVVQECVDRIPVRRAELLARALPALEDLAEQFERRDRT